MSSIFSGLKNLYPRSSLVLKITIGFSTIVILSLVTARIVTSLKKRKKITRIIDTIEEFMKPTVRMKDPDKVEEIVCQFINGGAERLQVIADFDRTLLRMHHNGQLCDTSHGILDKSPLIPEECRHKARLLRDKFYPIEIDPQLSVEEKIPFMVEWYTRAHKILMDSGVRKSDLSKMVEMSNAMLRDGCDAFFDTLYAHNIPLLIFSAGLGDLLEEVLQYNHNLYPNTKIISNYMQFDEEGMIIGFRGELVHMYNKNQGAAYNTDYFSHLVGRPNVILLGDSLGDLDMAKGMKQPSVVLKIGFLNDKIEESLYQYLEGYDIVLIDDQSMDVINGLLRKVL